MTAASLDDANHYEPRYLWYKNDGWRSWRDPDDDRAHRLPLADVRDAVRDIRAAATKAKTLEAEGYIYPHAFEAEGYIYPDDFSFYFNLAAFISVVLCWRYLRAIDFGTLQYPRWAFIESGVWKLLWLFLFNARCNMVGVVVAHEFPVASALYDLSLIHI